MIFAFTTDGVGFNIALVVVLIIAVVLFQRIIEPHTKRGKEQRALQQLRFREPEKYTDNPPRTGSDGA